MELELERRIDNAAIERHRRIFFETLLQVNTLQVIRSPSASREQLFSTFVNNSVWLQDLPSRYSLLGKLRDWFEPRCNSNTIATDSLLLLHFARITHNHNVAEEARTLHRASVYALKHKLEHPAFTNQDTLLVSLDALGICHLYERNPKRKHAAGLRTVLTRRGPQSLLNSTGLTKDLIFNAIHVDLMDSMKARRRCIFGEPRWSRALASCCSGHCWCLFHLACQIPAALELVDNLQTATGDEVETLFHNLVHLERWFQDWLLAWYEEIEGSPLRSNSIMRFPAFVARFGSIVATFPQAYVFDSFSMTLGHLTYWTMLLPLREAIYDIAVAPQMRDLITSAYHNVLLQATNECADSICQTAAFVLASAATLAGTGSPLSGALLVARRWFERNGDHQKAGFCQSILTSEAGVAPAEVNGSLVDSIHWIDVDGYLFRRLLWQNVIGPSTCVKARKPPKA